jgi:hypothetical protein
MATEGGRAHTGNRAISRGVLTIRTIRGKTITCGEGCDRPHLPYIEAICKELIRWQMVTPIGSIIPY